MTNASVKNFLELNDFLPMFLDELERNYGGADNSGSIARYITLRIEDVKNHRQLLQAAAHPATVYIDKAREYIDKLCALFSDAAEDQANQPAACTLPAINTNEGESILAALKEGAASARANVSEYHGAVAESVIRSAIQPHALGMNDSQKIEFSKIAGNLVAGYGAQYGEDGAQRTLLHQIMETEISEEELLKYVNRSSAFISMHRELSEDELLAAFYITCRKMYGELNDAQIYAIGYCVGMTQEMAGHVRARNPMKNYDAFFADSDTPAYAMVGGYMLIVASVFLVKFGLKVTGAMMWPAIIALSLLFLGLYVFILNEMENGRIRKFIESAKVHQQTRSACCRVVRYSISHQTPILAKANDEAPDEDDHHTSHSSSCVYA